MSGLPRGLLLWLIVPAGVAGAQIGVAPVRSTAMRFRPAVRVDAILARDPSAQVAAGVAVASAYNVRLELDAGVGGVSRAGGWQRAGRLDLLGRWLADPFRQSRWGLTAGGGIGVLLEESRAPRPVAVVTLGIEGPGDGMWVPGVEAGLGGGARIGLTLRRAPLRRR